MRPPPAGKREWALTHRRSRQAARLGLAAVLAVGLAGCGSPTATPSAQPSQAPSASATPTLGPTTTPSPTPVPTVRPTPTPTPPPRRTPAPKFVATGSMHVPRFGASATLLANGKVLIAGGYADDDNVLASAELYDPSTGKFTMTGSMITARGGPIATLLRDGRVLIAGGAGCRDVKTCASHDLNQLPSAEIYNPNTGKFSPTGSMSFGRGGGNATLLRDGRVLLAADSVDGLSAELYNPDSGKFTDTGSVMGYYYSATATLLPNGKVLIAGDLGRPAAELFDPATGKFAPITYTLPPGAAASAKRDGSSLAPQTATLLKDGRVLLSGPDYLETYTPATGAFAPASFASPSGPWYNPTATLLNDGDVLYAGGSVVPQNPDLWIPAVASAGLYDPVSGFQFISSMHAARYNQTATLLPNGSVLIAGGKDIDGDALSSAELFVP